MELEDDFGEARGGASQGEGKGGRRLVAGRPRPGGSRAVSVSVLSVSKPSRLQWVVDYFN